jgi:hypothetical protein
MEKASDSYSPEEFAAKLRSGKLDAPPLTMTGMMKISDKDGCLSFTRIGCDNWLDIPFTLIDKVEQLGWVACKDHAHPRVRIRLKSSEDVHQAPLLAMARHLLTSGQRAAPPPARRLTSRIRSPYARVPRRAIRRNCDNEQLAICLDDAENAFDECQQGCLETYPDDPSGYNDCRNDCRDTRADTKNGCYDTWCEEESFR